MKFFKRGSGAKRAQKPDFNTITRMITRFGDTLSLTANKESGLWILGRLPSRAQYVVAGSVTVIALVTSGALAWHSLLTSAKIAEASQAATSVSYHAARLALNSNLVLEGTIDKLSGAEESVKIASDSIASLKRGGVDTEALQEQWSQVLQSSKKVFANAEPVAAAAQNSATIREAASKASTAALRAQTVFSQTGQEREAARMAYAQQLAARIQSDAQSMTQADKNSAEAASRIERDAGVLEGLFGALAETKSEVDLGGLAKTGAAAVGVIKTEVGGLAKNGGDQLVSIAAAKSAGMDISDLADAVYGETQVMLGILQHESRRADREKIAAAFAALFVVAGLWLAGAINLNQARIREREAHAENTRQQGAIMRLLNEMGPVADGDLTQKATVTEEITGALADSLNHTLDEMAQLIRGIVAAAASVDEATTEVRTNAYNGADAVMAVSNGMAEIRERIQETSKQIKRLGESSQEIGDIVNLVSDISEQTNILAMNAAIQAASAGEAGRGFSVVANEVQKLAERSSEATRSISALVQAIQTDAAQAVASMETSTQSVVDEAKRTEQSADALQSIVNASDKLRSHAENLSGSVSGFKIEA